MKIGFTDQLNQLKAHNTQLTASQVKFKGQEEGEKEPMLKFGKKPEAGEPGFKLNASA